VEHLLWRTERAGGELQAPWSYRRFRLGEARFDELIAPADPHLVRAALARWLAAAHEEAARVAEFRGRNAPRAEGTDRYEYLVNEGASSLHAIPGVKFARPNGSFLVWLGDTAIYQFRFADSDKVSPIGAVLSGTAIRELVGNGYVMDPLFQLEEPIPVPPPFHEMVLLAWAGNLRDGLATAFVGKGTTNDAGQIQWAWLEPLLPEGALPVELGTQPVLPPAFPGEEEPTLPLGLRRG
jgi:hypothetical protein